MWKNFRWFRKRLCLVYEDVFYIIRYDLSHEQNGTKVVLTVHLPSKRVSEKHYNETGTIIKYIAQSPIADEHIEYLCAQDNRLSRIIREIEERAEDNKIARSIIIKCAVGLFSIMIFLTILIINC